MGHCILNADYKMLDECRILVQVRSKLNLNSPQNEPDSKEFHWISGAAVRIGSWQCHSCAGAHIMLRVVALRRRFSSSIMALRISASRHAGCLVALCCYQSEPSLIVDVDLSHFELLSLLPVGDVAGDDRINLLCMSISYIQVKRLLHVDSAATKVSTVSLWT